LTAYCGGIGHIASAYSIVEILFVLYIKKILKYDAANPKWAQRDRLIVSKGHGSLALYTILSLAGFFKREELWTFCRQGTRLGGEPNPLEIPCVEAATGSLGHGLSIGIGMALAQKLDDINSKTYVIIGDGEQQEGNIWEAAISAANFKLDNLTVILDNNHIQKMGFVKDIISTDDWRSKWESFGWNVSEVNGHNIDELQQSFLAKSQKDKPRIIIADTIKGKGLSIMENAPQWHYKVPNKKEMKQAMQELDISEMELEQCKKNF
ncbi:MAG: transketolase, partial [Endomicrobium sp.]|nr:transketolase [Endomicrobium sp.]